MSVTRVRNAPVVDYSWQSDAACMGANGELFLGPDEERPRDRVRRENLALLVCNACPVRSPCLEHALAVPERHGVWGGSTPEQRLTMRRGGLHLAGEDEGADAIADELADAELADAELADAGLAVDALLPGSLLPDSLLPEAPLPDALPGGLTGADAAAAVSYVPTGRTPGRRRARSTAVPEFLQL